MRGIVTRMRRIPLTLVEWTSIILILLAVTVTTFSEQLPIAKTSPSIPANNQGCLRFRPHSHDCTKRTPRTCLKYVTRSGTCKTFSTDTRHVLGVRFVQS